jgi:hypothetical protein
VKTSPWHTSSVEITADLDTRVVIVASHIVTEASHIVTEDINCVYFTSCSSLGFLHISVVCSRVSFSSHDEQD